MKFTHALAMLLLMTTFVFAKCHKDDTPPPPPTPTGPTDTTASNATRITKAVLTSGSDVTTQTYQYDAQNRLAWYSNTSTQAGYFEDTSAIVRDAQGIIKQIVYRSDTSRRYPDPKVDSIVQNVTYDAASSKYLYKVAQYKMFTTPYKDSTTYAYDAQSHISQENAYYFDYKTTKKYIKWATYDYTYNAAGDLTNWKTTYYDIDASHTDYPFETAYTYDDKGVNLLSLGNEGIVVGLPQNYSAHIPKTQVATYPKNPEYNQSLTYNYTFNTKYYPLKADITDAANSNAKSTLVFSYQ